MAERLPKAGVNARRNERMNNRLFRWPRSHKISGKGITGIRNESAGQSGLAGRSSGHVGNGERRLTPRGTRELDFERSSGTTGYVYSPRERFPHGWHRAVLFETPARSAATASAETGLIFVSKLIGCQSV